MSKMQDNEAWHLIENSTGPHARCRNRYMIAEWKRRLQAVVESKEGLVYKIATSKYVEYAKQ